MIWFFLLLLGLLLYFIVQHSVVHVTQTPWWILWAVLMAPAVLMVGWVLANGTEEPIPPFLVIGSFLMSSILYVALVRLNPKGSASPPSESQMKTIPEPEPLSLTKAEESQLQTCFPWSTYFLQKIDYKPQAIICRGQLKAQASAAYQTIRDNVRQQFGDRYLVIFQVGAKNQPFFALVPDPQRTRKARQLTRPGLALGLLFVTFITTTLAGAKLVMPELTWQSFTDIPALEIGLPYAIAIMLILGIHESGHYLAARYYKIKATLPYFIPMPPPFSFGTFGAFIQMRSPVPNRTALFDVGLAGPLAGFVVTVPLLVWGLMQSTLTSAPAQPSLLDMDAFNPSTSVLFALISKAIFPTELTMAQTIDLHPVAIAGWLGLVVTALNLMPVGQLDGGHIVHAMFGHRNGAIIGQVTRLLVLLLSFIQPLLLLWAIILLCLPAIDEPALNDVSELDHGRDLLGLISLALLLLIVLPLPHSLAHLLFEMG